MKLTTLLLIIGLLHASAKSFSQVTLSSKNVSLEFVLKTIKKQSGYAIIYENKIVDGKRVSVNLSNAPVSEALDACLSGLPLTYEVVDKTVVIRNKELSFFDKIKAAFANINVTGRVVDENNQPIPGATIREKSGNGTTVTDVNGYFTLNNINEKAQIIISFIGYQTTELPVAKQMGNILLKVATSKLDEVQVIAYGSTTQRLTTGDISSVKAQDIEKQPVNNPLLALSGRVAGVQISQSTGVNGGGVVVRIQGQNSLRQGSDPLYVIDGTPYVSQMLPDGSGGIFQNSGGPSNIALSGSNPMALLDPASIESIEILKDADATSIYGSRAANGAILITTKKGKAGRTNFDASIQTGWGQVPHFVSLMNTQQYLAMRKEAKQNDNAAILPTDYDLNGTWDANRYTDWQKELLGKKAQYTDAQVAISGGTGTTSFRFGGGFHRETSVTPGNTGDKKGSASANINHTSADQRFKFQFSGNYVVDQNTLLAADLTAAALRIAPNAPALYNADGTLNWQPTATGTSSWYNPLRVLEQTYSRNANNLISNATLGYELIKGLEIKASLGYNDIRANDVNLLPLSMLPPEQRSTATRASVFTNSKQSSYNIEPQLTYKRNLGQGLLDVLVGGTFNERKSDYQRLVASGFNNDLVMRDIKAATSITSPTTGTLLNLYRYTALFGRVNYNWRDKYVINVAARRDGSSRFGSENLFNTFGSVGGAWIFTNEDFAKNTSSWLSFGKLRASYGTTGNDQIPDYQFMNLYTTVSGVTAPYQGATSLTPAGLPNPYIQWESTRKLQFGLDLGFLKDRILFNAGYYRNRSSNQLQTSRVSDITGFTSLQQNLPALIQNTGFEFTLSTKNISSAKFNWSTDINLTIPRNKLISYPDLATSSFAGTYVIGGPITITRLVNLDGVDPTTGVFIYRKEDGSVVNGTPASADIYMVGNTSPTMYGGLANTVSYKSLSLDFLFQFSKQRAFDYHFGSSPGSFSSGSSPQGNQPTTLLNHWQQPGDVSDNQRYFSSTASPAYIAFIYTTLSNKAFVDASYLRLKNVSLNWMLPSKWTKAAHIPQASLFANAQNVFTVTSYIGLDPETQSVNTLPTLRVFTFGTRIRL